MGTHWWLYVWLAVMAFTLGPDVSALGMAARMVLVGLALLTLAALAALTSSCGLRRHPYENPITKDTQQPDKVLFDKAIHDIEHSRQSCPTPTC